MRFARSRSVTLSFGLALVCLGSFTGPASAAFTPLYSNTTNFTGYAYAPGSGTASVGGQMNTLLLADDITAGTGLSGYGVNQISFSVYNANTTNVSAGVDLVIFSGNGAGGEPGTVLTALNFGAITFGAGGVGLFTYTSTTSIFNMPSGLFWVGLSFNDLGGTTGANAAQLNGLGQGIFDPPTVGSSNDLFFQSSAATNGESGNPTGGLTYFGGSPHGNFGFSFATSATVPEPSSLILVGSAGLILAGVRLGRSRQWTVGNNLA